MTAAPQAGDWASVAGRSTHRGLRPPSPQATSRAEGSFWKARPYSVTGRMPLGVGLPRQASGPEWTSDDWRWLRWLDSMADCMAPAIAAPQVLISTPLSLYLLRIIHWVVHHFNRLCMCPLFTYSHTHGLRLEDVLCAPPISTLHVRMAAGPQTPTHPDTVAYYFARLQNVLTVEWLPHGMPDGSQIYRCMVPGTPPGHYLQERGAPMPPQGSPAPDRAMPPGPPNTPPRRRGFLTSTQSGLCHAPTSTSQRQWQQRHRRRRLLTHRVAHPFSKPRRPQALRHHSRTRSWRFTSPQLVPSLRRSRVTGPNPPRQRQRAPQ